MTRRKKLAIAGIAVTLALATGIGVVLALRPPSLQQRLEQVRKGMTYAEVVEIMGQPNPAGTTNYPPHFGVTWESRRGQAAVIFNVVDERVSHTEFSPVEPTGFLDRVLAWLGF
jgi:hypothetical protein